MARQLTFRDLVDRARDRGAWERPRTMDWAARLCGISRAHLYNLIRGDKTPPAWTVQRIANGLGLSVDDVEAALRRSRC